MLTEIQKANFTNTLRAWLNQEQTVQDARLTIIKNSLTETQLATLYKQIVTDLFTQADVALTQITQQKTALETEKNSITTK